MILLVVHSVSQPSRVLTLLSSAMPSLTSLSMKASRTASDIWSQTLSGCPSDTDSLVNSNLHVALERLPSSGCPRSARASSLYYGIAEQPALLTAAPISGGGVTASPCAVKMWAESGRRSARGRSNNRSAISVCRCRQSARQVDDPAAQLGIADAHEGLGPAPSVRRRQEIGHIGRRGRIHHSLMARSGVNRWRPFEEECNRDLENMRDLL